MGTYEQFESSQLLNKNYLELNIIHSLETYDVWWEDSTCFPTEPDRYEGKKSCEIFSIPEKLNNYTWQFKTSNKIKDLLSYHLCCLLTEDFPIEDPVEITCDPMAKVEMFDRCWFCCCLGDNPKLDIFSRIKDIKKPEIKYYSFDYLNKKNLKQLKKIADRLDIIPYEDNRKKISWIKAIRRDWTWYKEDLKVRRELEKKYNADRIEIDRDFYDAEQILNPELKLTELDLFDWEDLTLYYRLNNFDKDERFSFLCDWD